MHEWYLSIDGEFLSLKERAGNLVMEIKQSSKLLRSQISSPKNVPLKITSQLLYSIQVLLWDLKCQLPILYQSLHVVDQTYLSL